MSPKTLYDKIWDAHLAHEAEDGTCLLYIDRHLVHEVTSPQAFEGLRMAGRTVHAPDKTIAVPDHNVPTTPDRVNGIDNEESRIQVEALDKNAKDFGIHYYPVNDVRQGIVHIVGPEQGWTSAGHDCGLRRQPHRDPWRIRGAGPWHRHLRGRTCAGHPDADPKEIQEHEGRDHRQAAPRCDRQGYHACRSSGRPARQAAPAM